MRVISKAELSRWAGVSRQAVTKACKPGAPLYDATHAKGVDAEHPIVREWLASHGVHEPPGPGSDKPKPKRQRKIPDEPPPEPAKTARILPPAQTGATPYEIKDLEHLTVREVVMSYGSVDGFKRFVESLKNIAEYKHRELRVRQQRGDLIERKDVAGLVFPMIEVAFARLVTDVPESVSKMVVARVEAGGPETSADVTQLIRNANSQVLKNLKHSASRLEILNNAT
jgi:hypothetical protein